MSRKKLTSIRMTAEGKRLMEMLAKTLGISQSAVLELAIREKARRDLKNRMNDLLDALHAGQLREDE